jgi:cytosine permease
MASLPDYVSAAKPVPQENRAAWYKNTAQTYAGIMLWFVFWQDIVSGSGTFGGSLAAGVGVALLALLVAALFCHFLTYLVPGLLGMKTGLPLYVVGTSTYGVKGGFLMPGFFMGCLQFGWLAVNGFFTCFLICKCFGIGVDAAGDVVVPGPVHGIMTAVFILLAVAVGLKGIQYVASVATFMPVIPLVVLLILLAKTAGGLGSFSADQMIADNKKAAQDRIEAAATAEEETEAKRWADSPTRTPLTAVGVFLFVSLYVVGFFATAGAAGVDFGMNNRDSQDVQLGGLAGIVGATFFAGGVSLLVVAGAYGAGMVSPENMGVLNSLNLMPDIVGDGGNKVFLILLAISAFAPACFPAFIAANSFKTTMPNFGMPAVGIGTACSILLAVSGLAGKAVAVFIVIGASFGPICGAMMADYLLSNRKWAGPRAGFNPAGWISWAVGFFVGAFDLIAKTFSAVPDEYVGKIPCPPMAALIVGFVLYIILAKAGLESQKLEMPGTTKE